MSSLQLDEQAQYRETLLALSELGFEDFDLNLRLCKKYNGNIDLMFDELPNVSDIKDVVQINANNVRIEDK